jgi:hypothetical protein
VQQWLRTRQREGMLFHALDAEELITNGRIQDYQ